jgi:hypothetical protein
VILLLEVCIIMSLMCFKEIIVRGSFVFPPLVPREA